MFHSKCILFIVTMHFVRVVLRAFIDGFQPAEGIDGNRLLIVSTINNRDLVTYYLASTMKGVTKGSMGEIFLYDVIMKKILLG